MNPILDVTEPSVLVQAKSFFAPPERLLMGPGPSNADPSVLQASSQTLLGHMHPEIFQLMDEVKLGLQYLFQTSNPLTLCVSGSGHCGLESVFCNLLEEGDKVLIGCHGEWGRRAADIAERYGAIVSIITANIGEAFTFNQIEAGLKRHRPKLFFVVQGESSSGVLQPLEGLGKICHKYDCLLAVDTVASLGGVPLFMDRWEIDAIYTGPQKVLGVPPGLTPISFSRRAQSLIQHRTSKVKVFYFDMGPLGDYWNCWQRPRFYHHTVPVTLLYALREGLRLLAHRSLPAHWSNHALCAERLREGIQTRLGLELFVKNPEWRLNTVTTIIVPKNCHWQEILKHMIKHHNVEIAGGLGPTVGKVFRIGVMGVNATVANVESVLNALQDALKIYSKI